MKGYVFVIGIVVQLYCVMAHASYTGPELKMPLPSSLSWRVNTAVGDLGDTWHQGVYYYSIDFGRYSTGDGGSKAYSEGEVNVLSAAAGTVTTVVKTGCSNGGVTCKVVVDHGGGYHLIYLHFATDTIVVNVGDRVYQGQILGKMGNTGASTGTHLHFQLEHDDGKGARNSSKLNPYLTGVTLEGKPWSDFNVNSYYLSTNNGFIFTPSSGNPLTCSDLPTPSTTGYACHHPTDRFFLFLGPTVYTLIKLDQVCADFKLILEVYHNGTFEEKKEPFAFTDPGSSCWNNYYHIFETKPWTLGSWTHKLYLQIAGQPRVLLKEVSYLVDF